MQSVKTKVNDTFFFGLKIAESWNIVALLSFYGTTLEQRVR